MAKAKKVDEVEETEKPKTKPAEPEYISVRSTAPPKADGGSVVVLWERDPAHPGGEAMIAGESPVRVGMSPAVSKLLRDGEIEEVED
jgi:hypothetical protein